MKILLVCAGGASTGLLLKKMEKHWDSIGVELSIKACGLGSYQYHAENYDIILMGPQVAYRIKEVRENTSIPVSPIASLDYGLQNCENIYKLAQEMYNDKEKN